MFKYIITILFLILFIICGNKDVEKENIPTIEMPPVVFNGGKTEINGKFQILYIQILLIMF